MVTKISNDFYHITVLKQFSTLNIERQRLRSLGFSQIISSLFSNDNWAKTTIKCYI